MHVMRNVTGLNKIGTGSNERTVRATIKVTVSIKELISNSPLTLLGGGALFLTRVGTTPQTLDTKKSSLYPKIYLIVIFCHYHNLVSVHF